MQLLSCLYKRSLGICLCRFLLFSVLPTLIFSAILLCYSIYLEKVTPPYGGMFAFGGLMELITSLAGIFNAVVLTAYMLMVRGDANLIKHKNKLKSEEI